MESIYIYTMQDLQSILNKPRTSILAMISKLNLTDTTEYYNKVKENGRDKIYYSQKLVDMLQQNSQKQSKEKAKTNNNNTSLNKSIITMYQEQIDYLKNQIESKDLQIERLQQIIAMKEQKELTETKAKLLEDTEIKKEKIGILKRIFSRKENI